MSALLVSVVKESHMRMSGNAKMTVVTFKHSHDVVLTLGASGPAFTDFHCTGFSPHCIACNVVALPHCRCAA